jgi:hypothetical protein
MLSPCDQIVESIKVGRKADGNPRNGAPGDDSIPHVIPLFPQRSDRADAGRVSARRLVCNSAAVCRNSVSSSRGSTPSASITTLTMESVSISSKRGSQRCELMRCSFHHSRRDHSAVIRIGSMSRSNSPSVAHRLQSGLARSAALGTGAPKVNGQSRRRPCMLHCLAPDVAANIKTAVAGILGNRRGTGAKRTGAVDRQLCGGIPRKGELDGEC